MLVSSLTESQRLEPLWRWKVMDGIDVVGEVVGEELREIVKSEGFWDAVGASAMLMSTLAAPSAMLLIGQ